MISLGSIALLGALAGHTEEPHRVVGFDEAIELAGAHPLVRAEAAALDARRAGDDDISSLTQNPQINVMPGYRVSPEDDEGFELQVGLQQSWNLAGLASDRIAAAGAERDALAARRRARALELRLEAAHQWIVLHTREQEVARAREEAELAAALEAKVEAAASSGVALASDVAEARAYVAQVRRLVLDAEGERIHAEHALARALSAPPGARLETGGLEPSPELPPEARWPGVIEAAAGLPDAVRTRLTALAARARQAEAGAEAGAQLTTGLMFQRESPESYIAWGAFGVTLPLFDRNQRAASQAAAAAAAAEVDSEAAALNAGHALAFALHEVEHSREKQALLQESLIPALDEVVRLRQRAYDLGEITILDLLRAQRRALEAHRELVRVRGARRWAEVEAWLMIAAARRAGGESLEDPS